MARELSKCFSIGKVPVPKGPERPCFMGSPGIALEIGCGVGFHPLRWAEAHPDKHLIAIEHTRLKYDKFARRLGAHPEIKNLFPVHAEAVSWVSHNILPEELDEVFILYPNPHIKSSQHNLRWHNRPFMSYLVECLKPGGRLTLATNIADYAAGAEDRFTQTWGLKLAEKRFWSLDSGPRTHFEKKYLLRGETCTNLTFEK